MNSSAPGRNPSSGKSVSRFTNSWPRRPCGRAIRPTTAISAQIMRLLIGLSIGICNQSTIGNRQSAVSPTLPYLERHLFAFALAGGRGERPQRRGRAPLTADHLRDVLRRHEQLDERHLLVL